MKYWYLMIICIGFAGLLIVSERKKRYGWALLFKSLASLTFVVFGALSFYQYEDGSIDKYIMIGLIFGAVGDILLNICHLADESNIIFFLGGLAFLAGHIMYIVALTPMSGRFSVLAIVLGVILGILILSLLFYRQKAEIFLKLEAAVYLITVSVMSVFCIFVVVNSILTFQPEASNGGTLFQGVLIRMLGGLLFLGSDTVLFYRLARQEEDNWILGLIVLATYYPAQCLIALSMQYI